MRKRNHVHQLRHWYSGIMVGIDTVLADDPMLNCRIESLRSPVRIVCDSRLRIPLDSNLCKSAREYPLIIACAREDAYRKKSWKNWEQKCSAFPMPMAVCLCRI